ncbi:integrase [Rhodobacteraceae bacterium WD3A24]|nr:integrase [Rhodobacteraceae bacterium WD3A24]
MKKKRRSLPPYVYRQTTKGRTYYYFRRKGVREAVDPDAPDFWKTYAALRDDKSPPPRRYAGQRTFKALFDDYETSERFNRLADRTKRDYLRYIRYWREKISDLPVAKMQRKDVIRAQQALADRPRIANYAVQVMAICLEHSIDLGWREDNPAKGVRGLKTEGKQRQPWPQDLIEKFREATPDRDGAPDRARIIFELCLGTGQRIGDVLKMRWDDIEAGGVNVKQSKTGSKLWVPFTPALAAVIDRTPRRGLTILAQKTGRQVSYTIAQREVQAVRRKIGAEDYDLHSLRYTAAASLAEAGCSDELIQAVTGHTSMAMVARYSAATRQRTRATEAQKRRK